MDLTPIKNNLSAQLAHTPRIYANLIRLKKRYNKEKYVYLHLIKKGDTLIEAGANIGYFTQLFAQILGKTGQLHVFEPAPSTFSLLERNCTQAKLPRHPLLNCMGLSNKEESAIIHLPEGDSGQASLIPHNVGSWENNISSRSENVTLTTLDTYIEHKGIKNLDFIKMDIEGAEWLALKGGKNSINRFRPLIHIEICSQFLKDFGTTPQEVIHFLEDLGYDRFFSYEENIKNPKDLRSLPAEAFMKSLNAVCACSNIHQSRLKRIGWK